MSFETQLKERLERSAAAVTPGDEVYARAEQRHHVHTRNRRIVGGVSAAVVVAVGALVGPSLVDSFTERPEPPIVQEPDPTPRETEPAPAAASRFLVANDLLLEEAGVPDGHPLRGSGLTLVRAYPLVPGARTYTDLVYEFEGGVVATFVETDDVTLGAEGGPYTLEGAITWLGEPLAIVSQTSTAGQSVLLLPADGGPARVIASGPAEIPGDIERVSVLGEGRSGVPPQLLIQTRDAKGFAGLVVYGLDGQLVDLDWTPFDSTSGPHQHSVTASGTYLAWIETNPEFETVRVYVTDPYVNEVIAVADLPDGTDAARLRIEFSGNDVVINGDTDRWHLDAATWVFMSLDDLPAGYVTLGGEEAAADVTPRDPAAMEGWTELPPIPGADRLRRVSATAWADGVLYAVGSMVTDSELDNRLYALDPAVEGATWKAVGENRPPSGMFVEQLTWTGDQLIALGVSYSENSDADRALVSSTFDPSTNRWSDRTATGHDADVFYTATWTGTDLIVWGGAEIDGSHEQEATQVRTVNTGVALNPTSGSWRPIAPSPLSPRGDHGAVWNGRRLVIFGGGSSDGFEGEMFWDESQDRDDAAVYDPATDTWATIQSPGAIGPLVATAWTGSEVLYWTGHLGPDGPGGWREPGMIWDPVTGASTPLPPPAFPVTSRRDAVASAWAPELGRWILWGGSCGEGCNRGFSGGTVFDPATRTWSTVAPPTGLTGYSPNAIWGDGQLFVIGGSSDELGGGAEGAGGAWRP